jgi:glucose-induced degradation protein 8
MLSESQRRTNRVMSPSNRRDLNVMIMNYLVHQGYPSAAVAFAREANLALSRESVDSISSRMKIRNQIHAGEIEKAIHDINTLNPQVPLSVPIPTLSPSLRSSRS